MAIQTFSASHNHFEHRMLKINSKTNPKPSKNVLHLFHNDIGILHKCPPTLKVEGVRHKIG